MKLSEAASKEAVPLRPDQIWSADFMSNALHVGNRFRAFTVIDDYNREAVAIEIDTSLTAKRLIRAFERLRATGGPLMSYGSITALGSSVVNW